MSYFSICGHTFQITAPPFVHLIKTGKKYEDFIDQDRGENGKNIGECNQHLIATFHDLELTHWHIEVMEHHYFFHVYLPFILSLKSIILRCEELDIKVQI